MRDARCEMRDARSEMMIRDEARSSHNDISMS
jgi:hypothetical protein